MIVTGWDTVECVVASSNEKTSQTMEEAFTSSAEAVERLIRKEEKMPRKPTLLIDFDGVIHDYHGWKGLTELNGPIEGARRALYLLERNYKLVCFTTRSSEVVSRALKLWGMPEMKITNIKEPAELILDDRAITFRGQWDQDLLDQIKTFVPHWKASKPDPMEETEKD